MDEEKDTRTEGSTGSRNSADEREDKIPNDSAGVSSIESTRTKKAKIDVKKVDVQMSEDIIKEFNSEVFFYSLIADDIRALLSVIDNFTAPTIRYLCEGLGDKLLPASKVVSKKRLLIESLQAMDKTQARILVTVLTAPVLASHNFPMEEIVEINEMMDQQLSNGDDNLTEAQEVANKRLNHILLLNNNFPPLPTTTTAETVAGPPAGLLTTDGYFIERKMYVELTEKVDQYFTLNNFSVQLYEGLNGNIPQCKKAYQLMEEHGWAHEQKIDILVTLAIINVFATIKMRRCEVGVNIRVEDNAAFKLLFFFLIISCLSYS
jgi:hypothetical protein